MLLYKFLNIIGLFLILNGTYYGTRGEFIQKNSLLLSRTQLYFSNMEHFKSMVSNKYNLIFGFLFVCFGTIIQGISLVVDTNKESNIYFCIAIIILLIILLIIIIKVSEKISMYYSNIFILNYWYKEYLSKTKEEIQKNKDIEFLKEFVRILKLEIEDKDLIKEKFLILDKVKLYLLKKESILKK